MPFAILLALVCCTSATMLTYLYLRDTIFWVRVCAGVCVGLTSVGFGGLLLAPLLGMKTAALLLILLTSLPSLLLLSRTVYRDLVLQDIRRSWEFLRCAFTDPSWSLTGNVVLYLVVAGVLWQLCDRAMFENVQGIFTGLDTNLGDLPFHLSVITSFAHGENFPPQHPEFAAVPMTYPFIVDFVTALFVSAGASIRSAFVWQNFAMMLAVFGLIHNWAAKLLQDRLAASLTPLLIFLSGGFGWWIFLTESAAGKGVVAQLGKLAHDYSIGPPGYRWGNALTTLFVPQRGILLGVGLVVIVWTLWLQASQDDANSNDRQQKLWMMFAGMIAGLLPLVHAHSFAVTMLMAGCFALLQAGLLVTQRPNDTNEVRVKLIPVVSRWLPFFIAAALVGIPQMLWATHGSAVQGQNFLGWQFGWDRGDENVFWFWIRNTGFFIPLLILGLAWNRHKRFIPSRALYFCLPFIICFIVPNIVRLAPWVWDNIKVLFYWWVATAPIVALVLAKMWRQGGMIRTAAVALLLMQTAAGGLDVWRAASGIVERQTFSASALQFAELLKQSTSPQSLILHAPTYNDPVYLTGRRTFVGYPGHLWSHGLDFSARLADLKSIYSGSAEAADLIVRNRIEFVVVGPLEELELKTAGVILNKTFFERYTKVGEVGEYRLYKTAQH